MITDTLRRTRPAGTSSAADPSRQAFVLLRTAFTRQLRKMRQRAFELGNELDDRANDLSAQVLIALRHQHLGQVGPH